MLGEENPHACGARRKAKPVSWKSEKGRLLFLKLGHPVSPRVSVQQGQAPRHGSLPLPCGYDGGTLGDPLK